MTALSIIWFPPYQCGMSQSAGKVTIERAPTPEGPWTPVSESSSNLDINGSGYWFEAGDNDVDQFYLRTVSSVKNGEGEEQWIDTLSQPLSFSTPAAGGNTAVAQNSGAAGSARRDRSTPTQDTSPPDTESRGIVPRNTPTAPASRRPIPRSEP